MLVSRPGELGVPGFGPVPGSGVCAGHQYTTRRLRGICASLRSSCPESGNPTCLWDTLAGLPTHPEVDQELSQEPKCPQSADVPSLS